MSLEATAASEMVGQWMKKRELMNKGRMKAVTMLMGCVKNQILQYQSICIVTKRFGMTCMKSDDVTFYGVVHVWHVHWV